MTDAEKLEIAEHMLLVVLDHTKDKDIYEMVDTYFHEVK